MEMGRKLGVPLTQPLTTSLGHRYLIDLAKGNPGPYVYSQYLRELRSSFTG